MKAGTSEVRSRLHALEHIGIKLGLDQIRALLGQLGRPDLAFASLAVAGTNGKGSVAAMLDRGLRAAGLRTGRYTSPHLVAIEERVVVDGRPADAETFDDAAERVLDAARSLPAPLTFFEATTGIALDVFRRAGVEVAVLEVGLGGRLDATNAVAASGVAITAIDLDHEQYLGDTAEAIAREKAGIIKAGSMVVLGPNRDTVEAIIAETCDAVGATLVRARENVDVDVVVTEGRTSMSVTTPAGRYERLQLALRGRHQVDNALTAIRLLEALDGRGVFRIPQAAIRTAVEDVVWPGRLELIRTATADVLIDGAHNASGARALAAYVGETYGRRVPMVVALMRDKKVADILKPLAAFAHEFVCTTVDTPRARSAQDLLAAAAATVPSVPAVAVTDPLEAIRHAATLGSPVVVAGSLYLAGAVRAGLSP